MFTTTVFGRYPKHPESPRPSILRKAGEEFVNHRITRKEFEHLRNRATIEAVGEMLAAGVEVISDGQMKWDDGYTYMFQRMRGVRLDEPESVSNNGHQTGAPEIVSKVKWLKPIVLDDYKYISERTPETIRPVLTGPFSLALMCQINGYDGGLHSLTNDLAKVIRREMEGLESEGVEYVLIEEPLLTSSLRCADIIPNELSRFISDPTENSVDSEIMRFKKASDILTVGMELNIFLGVLYGNIPRDTISLANFPYDGISFDMTNVNYWEDNLDMMGELSDKIIQLGIVNSFTRDIEPVDELTDKMVSFSAHHDPSLIWVSPTSGFTDINRDTAFRKLSNLYSASLKARKILAQREEPTGIPDEG